MSEAIEYFDTVFPEAWDIAGRVFGNNKPPEWLLRFAEKKGMTVENNFPKKIILSEVRLAFKDDYEEQLIQIMDWFKKKPYYKINLRNDLFFGCGAMLIHHQLWNKIFPMVQTWHKNTDHTDEIKILRYLNKTIELLQTIDLINKEQVQEQLISIRDNLIKTDIRFNPNFLEERSKAFYGQKLKPGVEPQRKHSPFKIQIAVYLRDQLMNTRGIAATAHQTQGSNRPTNYRRASEVLFEIAELFGVDLPKELRLIDTN